MKFIFAPSQVFTCSHNFLPAEVCPVREIEAKPRPLCRIATRISRPSPICEVQSTWLWQANSEWAQALPAKNNKQNGLFSTRQCYFSPAFKVGTKEHIVFKKIFWINMFCCLNVDRHPEIVGALEDVRCFHVSQYQFLPHFPSSTTLFTTMWYGTGLESWWHHKSRLPMTFPTIHGVTCVTLSVVCATLITISARQTWSSSNGTPKASRPTTATTAADVGRDAGRTGSVGRGALKGNILEPSASTTQRSATWGHKNSIHKGGIPTARKPCDEFSRPVTRPTRWWPCSKAWPTKRTASSRTVVSTSTSIWCGISGTRTLVVVVNSAFRPATAPSFKIWKLKVVLPPPPTNATVSGHPKASHRLPFEWPMNQEAKKWHWIFPTSKIKTQCFDEKLTFLIFLTSKGNANFEHKVVQLKWNPEFGKVTKFVT